MQRSLAALPGDQGGQSREPINDTPDQGVRLLEKRLPHGAFFKESDPLDPTGASDGEGGYTAMNGERVIRRWFGIERRSGRAIEVTS